jgi:cytochrome c553
MQKRTVFFLQLVVIAAALVFAGGISIASDAGPEEMELKTAAAKKPAKFPHRKHQESFTCADCHHTKGDDGKKALYVEGMEIKKCISCHNKDDMDDPKMNNFKVVAHGLCKECHKKNKDTAPTKCSGCHIK